MKACPFCAAFKGEGRTPVIYKDTQFICVLDLNPINPGHVLVIPSIHEPSFTKLPDQMVSRMMRIGKTLAQALKTSKLPCGGIDLILTDGEVAGQSIPHCHLHVVPRVDGDGFRFTHGPKPATESITLEAAAGLLRASLEAQGLGPAESESGNG